jgi:hypothetical protein
VVIEMEVDSVGEFMKMAKRREDDEGHGGIMNGYHDLVDHRRCEIYT